MNTHTHTHTQAQSRFGFGRLLGHAFGYLCVVGCLATLPAAAQGTAPIKAVGMIVGDLGNPFFVAQRKAAEAAAARIDPTITVTTVAHTYDLKKQIDLIENLISGKADLLLLESAGDNSSLKAVIAKAHAAGITVIGMHSDITGADASVMTDNVMAGSSPSDSAAKAIWSSSTARRCLLSPNALRVAITCSTPSQVSSSSRKTRTPKAHAMAACR